ncbi:AbrB/MazE/SpoVT family DNA-binding domain-containing protein [Thermosulfurimonas sp. F29]|uniref:AbrB/MazE/SpoVT family DNA-binding domain-containing protein n=1 Tax=Thermosulfurimonas sp. F29 TaxID=2867247 RepID=UPI001C833BB7|nr:AbrB/MazE/SpoVT family DNA-binding domain-containing protein [Thermosulfurimonas sp. F29]MBX6423472.1 AbrB/MazE/SpoVT family DNA-binding domain-containing protein [Thermosulfurimonas sp. F29]
MEVRLDKQGRIVIPAKLRQTVELRPGDPLIVRVEGGRIILERKEAILERVKQRFAAVPPEVDLAEELIAERNAEVRQEG